MEGVAAVVLLPLPVFLILTALRVFREFTR